MSIGSDESLRRAQAQSLMEWTRWIAMHPPRFSPERWTSPRKADMLLRAAVVELLESGGTAPEAAAAVMRRGGAACLSPRVRNALELWTEALHTELARAYTLSLIAGLRLNDEVIGVRYCLSPRHPAIDVCDLLANANLFGLGSGVYPLDRVPYPAHPGTLSYVEAVFHDERGSAVVESPVDWLNRQPLNLQSGVLGSPEKLARLHAGMLTETEAIPPPRAY